MSAQQNEWVNRQYEKLLAQFGNKCEQCGSTKQLEFAHTQPTKLNGKGRGKGRRVVDIRRNPACYRLLCRMCHVIFDQERKE